MSLSLTTDLGEVKISDQILAKIIMDAMSVPELEDKVWPATEHGRQIGVLPKIVDAEFASNIEASYSEKDGFKLEFNVITKFGQSIKGITGKLADMIYENMDYILGIGPSEITINIAGVKSKQIAKRNTKAVYRYGTN